MATSPIANELRLDALDVQIPEGLRAYLEKIGFDFTANDYDGDGKLNAQELALAADSVARSTESFSAMHRAVLAATAEGVEALLELNLFLAVFEELDLVVAIDQTAEAYPNEADE